MFWLKKNRLKNALKANNLIHDAIVMGVADKFIEEEKLENDEFGLQLLARALNWAIPNLTYDFEKDLEGIEDDDIKRRLIEEEDEIFKKGLNILNSDQVVCNLATFYVAYEIYLIDTLFNENEKKQYTGLVRMRKFMFQNLDQGPDLTSPDFSKNYKELFVEFNNKYGAYGKFIEKKTVDELFSFVRNGL